VLALATGIAAGVGFALINAKRWHASPDQTVAVGIAAACTTAAVQLVSLVYDEVAPRQRRRRRQRATGVVRGVQPAIAGGTKLKFDDVGVTVWHVRWSVWGACLHQIAHEPSAYYRGPSNVRWTRGKGVIGEAWRSERSCHADFRELLKRFPDGLTADEFRALEREDPATLRKMDRREFNAVVGKYREVFAEPIKSQRARDRGKVIGVVTIDLAMYRGLTAQEIDALRMGLSQRDVTDLIGGLAVALADQLS
jgi:hypothetical protein